MPPPPIRRYRHVYEGSGGLPRLPEPVSEGPFRYGFRPHTYECRGRDPSANIFRIDEVPFAGRQELLDLCAGYGQNHGKTWFVRQLEFYGIPHDKNADVKELRANLEDAFKDGKVSHCPCCCLGVSSVLFANRCTTCHIIQCDDLAPEYAAIRDRLAAEYNKILEEQEDALFQMLNFSDEGYSAQAEIDPPRFVARYFLEATGEPRTDAIPKKLRLETCADENSELTRVVRGVPGLGIYSTTGGTTLVAWEDQIQSCIAWELERIESCYTKREDSHSLQASFDLPPFLEKSLGLKVRRDSNGVLSAVPVPPGRDSATKKTWESATISLNYEHLADKDIPKQIMALEPKKLKMAEIDCPRMRVAVIGWCSKAVDAEISRLQDKIRREEEGIRRKEEEMEARFQAEEAREAAEERAAEERRAAVRKARWERRVVRPQAELAAARSKPREPLGLQHLPGSYIVQWHAGEDRQPTAGRPSYQDNDPSNDLDLLSLNIFPPEKPKDKSRSSSPPRGLRALFRLGTIEGLMLLALSRKDVQRFREEQPKNYQDSDPGSDRDDEEYLAYPDTWCSLKPSQVGKRLQGATESTRTPKPSASSNLAPTSSASRNSSKKRPLSGEVADPYGVLAARAKRQQLSKASLENSNKHGQSIKSAEQATSKTRVYFQFVCNLVDDHPIVDDRHEHVGYFDFDHSDPGNEPAYHYLVAKGIYHLPTFLGASPECISIHKVSDDPTKIGLDKVGRKMAKWELKEKLRMWCTFDDSHPEVWGSYW